MGAELLQNIFVLIENGYRMISAQERFRNLQAQLPRADNSNFHFSLLYLHNENNTTIVSLFVGLAIRILQDIQNFV